MSGRSVRELLKDIQARIRDGNVPPTEAAILLARCASLYGNVLQEAREAELAYKQVLATAYTIEAKAARAKIVAETSPEYARYREADDAEKLTLEISRALKHILRSLEEEMRMAKHG